MVLGIGVLPLLRHAEAVCLERDSLMCDRARPGFTRLESDLVEQLRRETLEVAREP